MDQLTVVEKFAYAFEACLARFALIVIVASCGWARSDYLVEKNIQGVIKRTFKCNCRHNQGDELTVCISRFEFAPASGASLLVWTAMVVSAPAASCV